MKEEVLDLIKRLNQQKETATEILQMEKLNLYLENHDKLQGYVHGLTRIEKHIESNKGISKAQLVVDLKRMLVKEEKTAEEDCGAWKNYSQGMQNAYKWFVNEIC